MLGLHILFFSLHMFVFPILWETLLFYKVILVCIPFRVISIKMCPVSYYSSGASSDQQLLATFGQLSVYFWCSLPDLMQV